MSRVVYRDKRIALEVLEIEGRDGSTREKAVIRHPGAVVILPLLEADVVMIRNHRVAIGERLLELPAGTLEGDDPPLVQAARELEEETGYRAGSLRPLTSFYASPGICDERMYGFVATQLRAGPQRLEPDEDIEVVTLPFAHALAAAEDGTIADAKTLALLLYWDRFRRFG